MSGHSKWSTIKRKKGALDAQKGANFTKVVKEIMSAVREGGGDINSNPRLKLIVQKAKDINMPKDKIEAAINRYKLSSQNCQQVIYGGRWKNGSAFIVECMTDNPTRTVGEVRSIFNKYGCSLVKFEEVSFSFIKKALFEFKKEEINDVEKFKSAILDFFDDEVECIETEDDEINTYCRIDLVDDFKEFLEMNRFNKLSFRTVYYPVDIIKIDVEDEEISKFIDTLYEIEDVSCVYTNIEDHTN